MAEADSQTVEEPRSADPEGLYPVAADFPDRVRFLLRYAALAPSTRNTQPWKFRLVESGVEIYADYARRLPVADPEHRELLISVGAAIMNLRVAAAHFGFAARVHYDQSGASDRPLALVSLIEASSGLSEELLRLFSSITRRRTNRQPFLVSRVPATVLDRLAAVGEGYQSVLHFSTDGRVNGRIAEMVAEADREQLADPAYRRDIAEWMRPDWTRRSDGIPGVALGTRGVASALTPWATKVLDLGRARAARDRNLCLSAPALVVVASQDGISSWLETGELLEHLLLAVVREGLQSSYFNMAVQVPQLRVRLRELLGLDCWPQVMLRLGYAQGETPPTPRRAVEDFIVSNL